MYLMIQNPGVSPIEGYTVLGVSTTRNSGDSNTIGQFGSGAKHSIGLLLRNDIEPTVFAGMTKLAFSVKNKTVDDGLVTQGYGQVVCHASGKNEETGKTIKKTIDLGFALEYGEHDWNNIAMAMREFVSNAIDRTIREEGDWREALRDGRLQVVMVSDNQVRAKSGYNRVFIPATYEITKFYSELGKRFLHFSEPHLLDQKILRKNNRTLDDDNHAAMIYKKGVLVRQIKGYGTPSLFDYNFGDELRLDESRNVDDYSCCSAAGKAMRDASPVQLRDLMLACQDTSKLWEKDLRSFDLSSDTYSTSPELLEKRKANWQAAWKLVAGDSVPYDADHKTAGGFIERKGFNATAIRSRIMLPVLESYGIITANKVLNDIEKKGMNELPATSDVMFAMKRAWRWLEVANMTNGKEMPQALCFQAIMDAETLALGEYKDGKVYINHDIAVGQSDMLLQTVLEELVHHVTGASDMSRDFQDFLFKLIVLMNKG